MPIEEILDYSAHISFMEWKALGDGKWCQCIHCKRHRFNKIPNEIYYQMTEDKISCRYCDFSTFSIRGIWIHKSKAHGIKSLRRSK